MGVYSGLTASELGTGSGTGGQQLDTLLEVVPSTLSGVIGGVLSGVIVSLVTLWLAERQRAGEKRRKEARRREEILASIGRELERNHIATRGSLDASNAHYLIGKLSTVAFERHGADLATVAPDNVESVFNHYSNVSTVREGIRALAGPPGRDGDETQRRLWIELSNKARVDVSNSATEALKRLGLPSSD